MTRAIPLVAAALLAVLPARASAECLGGRPVVCALVNDDRDIFVGRVLGSQDGETQVHVVRSFRGTLSGDISVLVWGGGDLPSLTSLAIGESYLLYVKRKTVDGVQLLQTPMACAVDWLPLSAVSKQELAFLERLKGSAADGRIFGTLEHVDGATPGPLTGIRITVSDGQRRYSATTDENGAFDIRGLPGGEYTVFVSAPAGLLVEADTESTIPLAAHGCFGTRADGPH